MKMIKKILVLTSGGDAPGMNAAIRAVVRAGVHANIEVFGCQSGYEGLLAEDIFLLPSRSVANCIQRGGTILGTGRYLLFKQKEIRDRARAILQKFAIDGLIVIGGDGSFRGATLLESEGGPPVIGIPATIDNDIVGTEYTLGFDTARNTALDAIDKIRDTASSHHRHFLVEVMGRNAGFLAVDVALAGGAELVLIPEKPLSLPQLVMALQAPRRQKASSIIVVAEADHPYRSVAIAEEVKRLSGLSYRVCVLGHVQRGGAPTLMDRLQGSMMGEKAVTGLCEGITQKMVAVQSGALVWANFPDPDAPGRQFADENLLRVNDILCA